MAVNYKLLRLVTLALNAFFLLAAIAVFVMSITFLSYPVFITWYIKITGIRVVCSIAIAVAVFLAATSAIGLVAALQENVKLLKIGIGLCVAVFVAEIGLIVFAFVMRYTVQEDVNDQIYMIMKKYGQDEYRPETDMWDFFQKEMRCCGSDGPLDWEYTAFVENGDPNQRIPRSCCKSYASTVPFVPACQSLTDSSLYFNTGCKDVVNRLSWAYSGSIAFTLVVVAIAQIAASLGAWLMARELSRDDEPYEFSPPPSTAPKHNLYSANNTMRSNFSYGAGSNLPKRDGFGGSEQGSLRSDGSAPPPFRPPPPTDDMDGRTAGGKYAPAPSSAPKIRANWKKQQQPQQPRISEDLGPVPDDGDNFDV